MKTDYKNMLSEAKKINDHVRDIMKCHRSDVGLRVFSDMIDLQSKGLERYGITQRLEENNIVTSYALITRAYDYFTARLAIIEGDAVLGGKTNRYFLLPDMDNIDDLNFLFGHESVDKTVVAYGLNPLNDGPGGKSFIREEGAYNLKIVVIDRMDDSFEIMPYDKPIMLFVSRTAEQGSVDRFLEFVGKKFNIMISKNGE